MRDVESAMYMAKPPPVLNQFDYTTEELSLDPVMIYFRNRAEIQNRLDMAHMTGGVWAFALSLLKIRTYRAAFTSSDRILKLNQTLKQLFCLKFISIFIPNGVCANLTHNEACSPGL